MKAASHLSKKKTFSIILPFWNSSNVKTNRRINGPTLRHLKSWQSSSKLSGHGSCSGHGSTRPTFALGSHQSQLVLEVGVHHLGVLPRAKVGVVDVELLVPAMKKIALRIVKSWEDFSIKGPVIRVTTKILRNFWVGSVKDLFRGRAAETGSMIL